MFLHKNNFMIVPMLFLCIGVFSCADYFFQTLKIEDASLDMEQNKVKVIFSSPVNAQSAKEGFSLTEDGKALEGSFLFDGKAMTFFSRKGISENHCYRVQVSKGVEDLAGNSMEDDYERSFYTKEDRSRPRVLFAETCGGEGGMTTAIRLSFNKTIDIYSFSKAVLIKPEVSFFEKWNDKNDEVSLVFKTPLFEKTNYSITVYKDLKNTKNNSMKEDFYFTFLNKPDYIEPEFSLKVFSLKTKGYEEVFQKMDAVDFSRPLQIFFNKKIEKEKIVQGISVLEKVSYKVNPILEDGSSHTDRAEIVFLEKAKWKKNYQIEIKPSITDNYGTSVKPCVFVLSNNFEEDAPPRLVFASIKLDSNTNVLSQKNNYSDLVFDPVKFSPNSTHKNIPITLCFWARAKGGINKISAAKSISLRPQNNVAEISLDTIEFFSYEEIKGLPGESEFLNAASSFLEAEPEKERLFFVRFNSTIKMPLNSSRGLVKVLVSKDLFDENKISLEEEEQLCWNKQ